MSVFCIKQTPVSDGQFSSFALTNAQASVVLAFFYRHFLLLLRSMQVSVLTGTRMSTIEDGTRTF
jgi:hypothetical protein